MFKINDEQSTAGAGAREAEWAWPKPQTARRSSRVKERERSLERAIFRGNANMGIVVGE
jgi:hypothetical protein